jgi:ribosomal protein S18 acetylase RimI-like enzyme
MVSDMEIRKYQESDYDSLVALLKRVFPDNAAHNEPARVIAAKLKVDDLIWVSLADGDLIGCCMGGYDGVRGWLYEVSVLREYRRKGVGAMLVKEVTSQLRALGCIKVNLQVRADNAEVVKFYKTLGFEIEDRLSMGVLFN